MIQATEDSGDHSSSEGDSDTEEQSTVAGTCNNCILPSGYIFTLVNHRENRIKSRMYMCTVLCTCTPCKRMGSPLNPFYFV